MAKRDLIVIIILLSITTTFFLVLSIISNDKYKREHEIASNMGNTYRNKYVEMKEEYDLKVQTLQQQIDEYRVQVDELQGNLEKLKEAKSSSDANNETTQQELDAYRKEIESLKKQLSDLQQSMPKLHDEYYEKKLAQFFTEDEMKKMGYKEWKYTLSANNKQFNHEDYLYLSSSEVTIALSETHASDLLPKKFQILGSITGGDSKDSFYNHLIIDSPVPWEEKLEQEGNRSTMKYIFEGVPRGTIITLRLTEALRERLQLDYNMLEVIINNVPED